MKKKNDVGFINDVREEVIIAELSLMEANSAFLTEPTFRGASQRWTDNYISFVDYHINYLKIHPALNPQQYISNLRLRFRKAPR